MRSLRPWVPAILWAALIWFFSTAEFSAEGTARIIVPLLHRLLPQASPEQLGAMHLFLRKAAHFVEFFIFSVLALRGLRRERTGWKASWGLAAVVIAAGYATLDELHQAFVLARTASPLDSLLDTCGAVAAQLLAWGRARWRARRVNRAASPLP